jgi:lipoprotein-anchoring transpeptidase ErfK/SrfK
VSLVVVGPLLVRPVAPAVSSLLALVVAAALLSGCGGPAKSAGRTPAKHLEPRTSLPVVSIPTDPVGSASTDPPAGSVFVATATVPSLPIYATPRALGPEQAIANPNPLGAPLTLLVNAVNRGWLQVYLPERPNESTGWVSETNVTLATDDYHIVVSLGARQVTLYQDGVKAQSDSAAVGSPDSPTPTGHFFVTEDLQLTDPTGPYGPYALGLSGFSNTYYSFEGGPGQIAIHGTNQPQVIGGYASHGCVRLTNPNIAALVAVVPAGTPVDIVN